MYMLEVTSSIGEAQAAAKLACQLQCEAQRMTD
jgi:hypothetical protein